MAISGKLASKLVRIQENAAAIARLLDGLLLALAALLLVMLVALLFLQVLFRYAIEQPLAFTEEGARYTLVWLSMIAASIAARDGQHFLFRWATLRLHSNGRFWLRRACDAFVMLLLGLIFYESLLYLAVVANQTSAGTGLNMRIPYGGVTTGSAVLFLVYLLDNIDCALSRLTGRTFNPRELYESDIHQMFEPSLSASVEDAR